jgi:hypothetical protein
VTSSSHYLGRVVTSIGPCYRFSRCWVTCSACRTSRRTPWRLYATLSEPSLWTHDHSSMTSSRRMISVNRGTTCNSQPLPWRGASCPSNMESNSSGTTSHKSGLRRKSSPGLSTSTRARGVEGAAITFPLVPSAGPQAHGPSFLYWLHQRLHNTTGGL